MLAKARRSMLAAVANPVAYHAVLMLFVWLSLYKIPRMVATMNVASITSRKVIRNAGTISFWSIKKKKVDVNRFNMINGFKYFVTIIPMNNTSSAASIFINTYRSFLRDHGVMTTEQIGNLYKNLKSSLHKHAYTEKVDIEAFMYAFLRLPAMIHEARVIVMAQIENSFEREGYKIAFWEEVHAPARRRK